MKKFIILILIITASCIFDSKEYLKIGTNVWPGYEPLYLARELGYLKNIPVHLVEYSSASQVLRAYRNRRINGAALTLDEVLLLKDYGFEPVVVLVMDISNGADVIIGRKGINSVKDLKGKKIGVENTALGAYVLTRALEKYGLSVKQVKVIPLEVDEHYRWFKEGKVDAVVTFEPVKSKLLREGGKIIFDSSQIPGEIVDVLVVERDFLTKSPHVVKSVISSWFKAVDFMKNRKEEALKIIAEREHISPEELEKAYRGMIIPDRKTNIKLVDTGEPELKKVAKKLLKIMRQKKIISKEYIDIDSLFYTNIPVER
ncbi:NitT/TauT family transport system substrate-binding protein [Persephonella hydrogeniphila]|uniref:NitT/TauT family transport system substrate-binding protein n=1 Tax=Persephonella hydrogeniphila TaxID=198703 RepID=A0A285NGD4_9AQUI|nr:ABC transporter substrate-binding protein [Persephonella hydrogeniphila]SNZ08540.1 NitT/TauT family transport system substrate-binding protein [Persephonella hydrogeniphila]